MSHRSVPRRSRPRIPGPFLVCALAALSVPGCRGEPEHPPDEVLRTELGLTDVDEVHRVTLSGGEVERGDPTEMTIPPGAWVEFVTSDWLIHEVRFELDSLPQEARAFLEGTDQSASPPLVFRDSRFVVSFEGAPPGRYGYLLEGNGRPSRGAVIVATEPGR